MVASKDPSVNCEFWGWLAVHCLQCVGASLVFVGKMALSRPVCAGGP